MNRTRRLTQTAKAGAFWVIFQLTAFWAFCEVLMFKPPLVSSSLYQIYVHARRKHEKTMVAYLDGIDDSSICEC